jgi:anti-sigma regulatory factor (Ser/Thr protein kinase)
MGPHHVSGTPRSSTSAQHEPAGAGGVHWATVVAAKLGTFVHDALFYSGDDEFVRGTEPFIRAGLDADEPTLVVVQRSKIALLRDAIGRDSRAVVFEDMHSVGRNPGCIIALWRDFVAQHATPECSVRGIGEPLWPGRSSVEIAECHQHEGLLNVAFGDGAPWTLLCPYDVDGLAPSVVEDARRTHPHFVAAGERTCSAVFDPHNADLWLSAPLPSPPASAYLLAFNMSSARTVRAKVSHYALDAGFTEDRAGDIVLAVNELVANSIEHGAGSGTFSMWSDSRSMICEVYDSGRLHDPLAGRRRPAANEIGGRGLWLANQLSDLTQLRCSPTGTRVRLHFALA